MTSIRIMTLFLAEYMICDGVCLFEKKYLLVIYWGSAALLNLAVLLMNKQGATQGCGRWINKGRSLKLGLF